MDERNLLAPVLAADPKVAVQREHESVGMHFSHPHQASIGQRHRHALVAAQQLPDPEATSVLIAAFGHLPEDRQIPVIQTLGKRRDLAAVPALAALVASLLPQAKHAKRTSTARTVETILFFMALPSKREV